MDNHKKLVLSALVLTAVATTASMVAYMTSVSSRSKAATREDIQKLVQSIYPSVTPTQKVVAPKFSVEKQMVKSAGTANLQTQVTQVDKTKLHAEYTNTTGKELKGARLIVKVSGKSKFSLGPATGATRAKEGPKLKAGYTAYTLPTLKPGETAKVDIPLVLRTPGASMKVTALFQAPGQRISAAAPVTVQSN